uniref:Sushi domain-containing protein n=1 Tax=Cyprinodon variegatus TaxID=28743 RepID=A0A3Q2DWL6_CYPVA
MEMGVLGFVLLLLVPALVHAQTSTPCSAPRIDAGFFLPLQESYSHGTKINYACDDGYKPPGKGWWGTSICIDGEWFGIPICVESLPVCSEPPKRLNAIIINQRYQEVFSLDTEVEYQCKDGYTTEQGATNKSVFCRAGGWTEGPTCNKMSCLPPTIPNGQYEETTNSRYKDNHIITVTCEDGFVLRGNNKTARCQNGEWSPLPVCESKSCMFDPTGLNIRSSSPIALKEGEGRYFPCNQWGYLMYARCSGGRIQRKNCEFKSNIIF